MARFSGAVKLADLNDFIAPSQACIVNLDGTRKAAASGPEAGTVQVQARSGSAAAAAPAAHRQPPRAQPRRQQPADGSAAAGTEPPQQVPVKVTLHDCLACSGCVTSAETVLLEHQSVAELQAHLDAARSCQPSDAVAAALDERAASHAAASTSGTHASASSALAGAAASAARQPAPLNGKAVVITLSPQSRASLAAAHGLGPRTTARRLAGFLKGLGAAAVLDASAGRDVALVEAAAEFVARYRQAHPELAQQGTVPAPGTTSPTSSVPPDRLHPASPAQLASSYKPALPAGVAAAVPGTTQPPGAAGPRRPWENSAQPDAAQQPVPLPLLASACPGWVCYAEKTLGEWALPHIAAVKSPQAVMGTLVKRFLAPRLGLAPEQVYHCAVMPCYDKKLEAARDDFNLPGTATPEVDCVLTSAELQQLLDQHGARLGGLPEGALDSLTGDPGHAGDPAGVRGGSGGYLEHIFRAAARDLFGVEVPPGPLPMRALRNADFQEVTLEKEGRVVLRFAAAYGFRNIQTLVRQMRRRACAYDYVEVMACPSGCLNGGGQLKPAPGQTTAQLIDQLEAVYNAPEVALRDPAAGPLVAWLYGDWAPGGPGSPDARALLHTQYHQREKTVSAALADW